MVTLWALLLSWVYTFLWYYIPSGVGFSGGSGPSLGTRLATMLCIAVQVYLVCSFDRQRLRRVLSEQRALLAEPVEASVSVNRQAIHYLWQANRELEVAGRYARLGGVPVEREVLDASRMCVVSVWSLQRPMDLRSLLGDSSLTEVLEAHVKVFATVSGMRADFRVSGVEPFRSFALCRILFEQLDLSLSNVLVHSGASRVLVRLSFDRPCVRLSVGDDGDGLPSEYQTRGQALRRMASSFSSLGGSMVITPCGELGGAQVEGTLSVSAVSPLVGFFGPAGPEHGVRSPV